MLQIPESIAELLITTRSQLYRRHYKKSHDKLAQKKACQKETFNKLRQSFLDKYEKLNQSPIDNFVTPFWKKYNTKFENILLPYPEFSFLSNPKIMYTMFMTTGGKLLTEELKFIENTIKNAKLKIILEEEYVGNPLLLNSQYLTSHTVIHHLYHIVKFMLTTKCNLDKINTVVEWGGGYGSMIRILKRIQNHHTTYIMIDTPLFCCLQWLYLSTILGEKNINLLHDKKDKIKANKINILSLGLLDNYQIKTDLFISTWALSESSKFSQDYVLSKNWFKAKHLLLAYQENPVGLYNPARIGKLAKKKGAIIEDIEFLPGNHYAFL